jgi:general stress protein 26
MGALPDAVEDILNSALVSEFTVINASGRPVTHPMIPLYDGEKIYMTSSVLFSKKLNHIRHNPKVAVSITDLGAAHDTTLGHRVMVQGDAVVWEDDPNHTWKRVMPLWQAKEPILEMFYSKRVALPLFWQRALIEITPRRVFFWEEGRTDVAPTVFEPAEAR